MPCSWLTYCQILRELITAPMLTVLRPCQLICLTKEFNQHKTFLNQRRSVSCIVIVYLAVSQYNNLIVKIIFNRQIRILIFHVVFFFCVNNSNDFKFGGILSIYYKCDLMYKKSLYLQYKCRYIIPLKIRFWPMSLIYYYLLKSLYQARKMSSHVFVSQKYQFFLFLRFYSVVLWNSPDSVIFCF